MNLKDRQSFNWTIMLDVEIRIGEGKFYHIRFKGDAIAGLNALHMVYNWISGSHRVELSFDYDNR